MTVLVRDRGPDVKVSTDRIRIFEGDSPGGTYTVVLTREPTGTVTITLGGTAGTDVTVNPASLTFTTSDWETAQTVSVSAAEDDDSDSDAAWITHTASGGGFGSAAVAQVAVEVTDNDREIVTTTRRIQIDKGATATYELRAKGGPATTVTVSLDVTSGSGVTVNPTQVTFQSATWFSPKPIRVSAPQDADWDPGTVTIEHTVSGAEADTFSIGDVAVWLEDPGTRGLPGRPSNLRAQAKDGGAMLEWDAPPEVPSKPVTHYEYQQDGETGWTPTDGPGTSKEVTGLTNGESYKFRLRAVNSEGKGTASEPSDPVTPAPAGLTASFEAVPASHDGSGAFTLELAFSEAVFDGSESFNKNRAIQNALEVTDGTVRGRRRADPGAFDRWIVWIRPSGDGAVTVTLPATTGGCDAAGAICTPGGEPLAEAVSVSVPGPATPRVSIAAGTSPVTEGTAASFTLSRTGDTAGALTVGLGVSEDGAVLSGTAPTEAVFAAGAATVSLTVATEDDEVVEDASVVTVTLASGTGYALDASASEATVTVEDDDAAPALPVVSIAAGTSPVTEGTAASFSLSRTGDTASALTVSVSVTEAGSVLSGTPPATVTFAAGSAAATLAAATDDDGADEADGRVTATVSAGSGYEVSADAASAGIDVYDDDEAASTAVETLWTSTLTVQDVSGVLLGHVYGNNLSPDNWSENGTQYGVNSLHYFAQYRELTFTLSAGLSDPEQLTLHLDDLEVQLSGVSGERFFHWTVDHPGWQAGQTVAVKLTREDPDAAVDAGPGISVADAEVQEAEGAVLSFPVTLAEAQSSAVSVRYSTSDGTAHAGADYEAVSGALRFEAGETAKTVSVPVLNDTLDEGSETLTLTLSAPFGATLSDDTATGTIVNTGPMPKAWITRFGRTVALQAVAAISERLGDSGDGAGAQLVVGGIEVAGAGGFSGVLRDEEARRPLGLESADWSFRGDERGMAGRELLLGSSFRLGAGDEYGNASWTAWGRFATGGFDGAEDRLALSGDVTTGFLGADVSRERWLAGLAVGVSEGGGSFDDGTGAGGTVESTLTSVFPYARAALGERVDLWGLVGAGSGDLELAVGEEVTETDLSMRMGALGVQAVLVPAAEADDVGLAFKSDALWVRTESDAARSSTGGNLEAASGDVRRVRLALEGSRAFSAGPGATLTPALELGLRHDEGDAETGTGVEAGFAVRYAYPARGLTVEGRMRGLLVHSDSAYRDWGASGSIRLDPGVSGRGVSLSIAPVLGNASGGVEQLWSRSAATGLAPGDTFAAEAGLDAELGYGLLPPTRRGVLTPYVGCSIAGDGARRTCRIGARWNVRPAFGLTLEASRGAGDEDTGATTAAAVRAAYRW